MADITIDIKVKKSNRLSQKERQYRREASRLASMANKRLKRIEEQNLLNSPSYKKWVEDGQQKFGIRGKTIEEVQQEVARMNNFLKQSTSTVTGAKSYFKNVADKIGVAKWSDFNDLQNKINVFFDATAKVKEYLHNSKEIGVAIGYQKIWETVSDYVQEIDTETESLESEVLNMVEQLVQGIGYGKADEMLDSWLDEL